MDGAAESVLLKKIGRNAVGRSPIPDIERLGEAITKEIETALRPILGAQIAGLLMDSEVTRFGSVTENLAAPSLVAVLSFPGAPVKCLMNFNAELVYHIVDLRMGGDEATCPMPTTRSLTAIDYQLCEEALQESIWAMERAFGMLLTGPLGNHFSVKDKAQNAGNVVVAPESADVLHFNISLDIGVAARSGDIDIALPLAVLDIVRSSAQPKRQENVTVKDIWLDRMRRAVEEAVMPLTAVLSQTTLPTETLNNLKVGQVIPIASNAPQDVKLVLNAGRRDAFPVTSARLGAFEGRKVLKLNASAEDALVRNINAAVREDDPG